MGCGFLCVSIPTLGGPCDWDNFCKDAKQIYLNDVALWKQKANAYRLAKGKGKLPPTPEAVRLRRERDEPSSPTPEAVRRRIDEEPGWTDRWLEGVVEYQGRQVEGLR